MRIKRNKSESESDVLNSRKGRRPTRARKSPNLSGLRLCGPPRRSALSTRRFAHVPMVGRPSLLCELLNEFATLNFVVSIGNCDAIELGAARMEDESRPKAGNAGSA